MKRPLDITLSAGASSTRPTAADASSTEDVTANRRLRAAQSVRASSTLAPRAIRAEAEILLADDPRRNAVESFDYEHEDVL
jgi:hypothetical protein